MSVLNLDVLRPEAKTVIIGGHELDFSFVPVGITFEIDDLFRKMQSLDRSQIESGGDESRKAVAIAIELCGIFCGHQVKELNQQWFNTNATSEQVSQIVNTLRETLIDSLKGVNRHPKNGTATKTSS